MQKVPRWGKVDGEPNSRDSASPGHALQGAREKTTSDRTGMRSGRASAAPMPIRPVAC
jgi:hypothetical protein